VTIAHDGVPGGRWFGLTASPWPDELRQIGALQARLNGPEAVLIGLLATLVAVLPALWNAGQHVHILTHEGGHALMGALVGHKVKSVTMKPAGEGLTTTLGKSGFGSFLFLLIGYFTPGLVGLGAAKMIAMGHIVAVLWLLLLGLVLLLVVARGFFAPACILATGVVLVLTILYAAVGLQVVIAYGITWFLLISGFTVAVRHGRGSGDRDRLRSTTHVPGGLWSALWLIGSVITLIGGATLLV
jgi:hypothetical protein